MYSLSVLKAIILVTYFDIMSYFSPLSTYYEDKYIAPDISNYHSTMDNCSLSTCIICRWDSAN